MNCYVHDRYQSLPEKAASLIGPGGIITTCLQLARSSGDPDVHIVVAQPQPTDERDGSGQNKDGRWGGGCSLELRQAFLSAVAEACERYSALVYDNYEFVAPAYKVECSFLPVRDMGFLISKWVEADSFFDRLSQRPLRWTYGQLLGEGRRVPVPVEAITPVRHKEFAVTSNGLACGSSWPTAVLAGLYELIERDCTMRSWYTSQTGVWKSETCAEDEELAEVNERISSVGLRIITTQIDNIGVTVAIAAITSSVAKPDFIVLGSAAGSNPAKVRAKAALEACLTLKELRGLLKARKPLARTHEFHLIRNFQDHVFLYGQPWAAKKAAKRLGIWNSCVRSTDTFKETASLPTDDPDAELSLLVRRLSKAGIRLIAVDVTVPHVREAGFYVAKVFATGLVPLFMGPYEAKYCKGFVKALRHCSSRSQLETEFPHPFP